jgi:hypothetical protein
MGLIAAGSQKKEDLNPPTNMRMGKWLLMKLLVKGTGSPFKENDNYPADEPKSNEDESRKSLT